MALDTRISQAVYRASLMERLLHEQGMIQFVWNGRPFLAFRSSDETKVTFTSHLEGTGPDGLMLTIEGEPVWWVPFTPPEGEAPFEFTWSIEVDYNVDA